MRKDGGAGRFLGLDKEWQKGENKDTTVVCSHEVIVLAKNGNEEGWDRVKLQVMSGFCEWDLSVSVQTEEADVLLWRGNGCLVEWLLGVGSVQFVC